MVEYKVVRVSDNGGSTSVVVQVPSAGNKTVPITFNTASFNRMSEEEIDYAVAEMVDQMFAPSPPQGVEESKIVKMQKHFGITDGSKPMRESDPNVKPSK